MSKVRIGLKIHFIYKGQELKENIYEGQNDVWFNFNCLYPDAQVLEFEVIYND